MNVRRFDAAFEMSCNKIFVLGGASNAPRSGEYYDLKTNKWHKTTDLIEEQAGVTSELINDKIYLFGNQMSSKVQYYDIASDIWSYTTDFPVEGLYWATSESYAGQIYIMGGYIPSEPDNPTKMYIFDPVSETYSEDTIPSDLQRPRSVRVDDMFYLWSAGIMYSYKPINDTWKKIESASAYMIYNQEAVYYKERMMFIGGSETAGKDSPATTDITVYDPVTDDWSIIPSSINYGRHYKLSVFSKDTSLFIVGGREAITWESIKYLEYISNLEL
ncbi:Kelch motif-containing protein [Marivirga sericea]|uniref:Kelch motif-containing protein n=1 Tax=Marivirga sericea TaxID=1028 RepID=A0A1X7L9R4_9BACT|nr:hypothetical protein [Marivirga sericea]SMG50224.1 Kelch motif-containing protein [Marivirga sericea]